MAFSRCFNARHTPSSDGSRALWHSLLRPLLVEGAQGLLEGLDLLLPLRDAVLIRHACLHARGLQLNDLLMDLSRRLCSSVRLVLSSSIELFVSASSPSF